MEIRSISVFYDNRGYPFQDQERTVRYPVFGNAFLGASNTTQIKFYIDRIGGNTATWVANGKLPNGVMGHQVLSATYDSDLGEHYVTFTLSSFFTQYKGDVYISLAGYDGDLDYTEISAGVYQINGTPVIQTTGSIKLNIAYATGLVSGEEQDIEFTDFFTILATKLNKVDGIIVVQNVAYANTNFANYGSNQVIYSKDEESLYIKGTNNFELFYDFNEYRDKIGLFKRSASLNVGTSLSSAHLVEASKPYCFMIYAYPTNDEIYIKTYDTSDLKFVKLDNEMTLSDSDKQYTQTYKSFTFNASGVVTSVVDTTINGYTKSGADTLLATKANVSDVYAKTETYSKTEVDNNFASLQNDNDFDGDNDFNGVNTYINYLPQSSINPTNDNDLTRKAYVDTQVSSANTYTDTKIAEIEQESDVVDIVGTYAQLQAYDTQHIKANDIIKVLKDETHNDSPAYYKWVITDDVGAWSFIGIEGPYMTMQEANQVYQAKIIKADLLNITTSEWTQGEDGYWRYSAEPVPVSLISSGDFLQLAGNDGTSAEQIWEKGINIESWNINLAGTNTVFNLVATFQPTETLNIGIVITKPQPAANDILTYIATSDLDTDYFAFIDDKLTLNPDFGISLMNNYIEGSDYIAVNQVEDKLVFSIDSNKIETTPTSSSVKLVTSGGIYAALSLKANASDTYTKTQVDNALSGKQNTLSFDNTPTEDSTNPVTSGGVYSALENYIKIEDISTSDTIQDLITTYSENSTLYFYVSSQYAPSRLYTLGLSRNMNGSINVEIEDVADKTRYSTVVAVGDLSTTAIGNIMDSTYRKDYLTEDTFLEPENEAVADGGTITYSVLKIAIQKHLPIRLNGYTGYFTYDDGTNYQYYSIIYDSVNNVNHINVATINKTTWVVTFHTSDIALN